MPESNSSEPITGYFVVLDEEEKRKLSENMKLDAGRTGIFYHREDLISTLQTNREALKNKEMHIFHVSVPQATITHPNCKKFGVKCGHSIPVIHYESFRIG